jgi:hypothetical protein
LHRLSPFGLRGGAAANVSSVIILLHYALTVATLGAVPHAPLVCDRVDVVELNRVYDDQGRPLLTQMIFWDWYEHDARLHVVAWRLWPEDGARPTRDWSQGEYRLLWHDGELLREVWAGSWRESWTQFDPEMNDRVVLPKSARRGLTLDALDTKRSVSPNAHP